MELSFYPVKAYIEKMLAEGYPSLKNLKTKPGVNSWAFLSGLLATENLTKALSTPLKIPV